MKIAVENSTWNNVGDAFYQESLQNIFSVKFPQHHVFSFDGPISRAFRPDRERFQKNSFDSRNLVDADLYIFSGPILGNKFTHQYGDFIKRLVSKGRHYAILSAHGTTSSEVVQKNREFLSEYPPIAFASRDNPTFDNYGDIAPNSLKGVCAAFFVGKLINSHFDVDPSSRYILSSFYVNIEPFLNYLGEAPTGSSFDLSKLQIVQRNWPSWRISRHLQFLANFPSKIGDFEVIRPVQDISYKFAHLNFAAPNSYLSYNPIHYLSLYANAAAVVSDRVHSCVAGLANGVPAILIGRPDRAALFDTGVVTTVNGVMHPLPEVIASRYSELGQFIDRFVESLPSQ